MQTKEQLMKDVVRGLIQCEASPKHACMGMEQLETQVKQWFSSKDKKRLITFKQARLNMRMSLADVSQLAGLHIETLEAYEEDSTHMSLQEAVNLCRIYKLSVDHVFWGKTPDGNVREEEDTTSAFLEFARRRIEESISIHSNYPLYIEKDDKITVLLPELLKKSPSSDFRSKLLALEDAYCFTSACDQENAYFQGFTDAIRLCK
ncbi:helix-turn-helix domain-containing protein [Paenibacillus aquistagni]|uniref:helix-turn-helix domain-containing protein n=1 Tax=Paenibacillus aquistagni TaxID=1852522 RepID=UPI00145BE32A|nr:helix-turn-helix transcriptional regulator [Paenibacillus aquistagni]NMM52039.1 helix-turn-helix transcriptional regulator [Paenibacillus aquistagni]